MVLHSSILSKLTEASIITSAVSGTLPIDSSTLGGGGLMVGGRETIWGCRELISGAGKPMSGCRETMAAESWSLPINIAGISTELSGEGGPMSDA